MSSKNTFLTLFSFDTIMSFASGPIIATLIMLIPLGMLIGFFEAIDPAFVAYEFIPEEILFFPWVVLSIFISAINVRTSYLLKILDRSSLVYKIHTDRFFTPPEDRLTLDEFPGKIISSEFRSFVIHEMPNTSCSMPIHKDYGWTLLFDNDVNSVIEISFALTGIDESNPHLEEYEISIDYVVPSNPSFRISFLPNPDYFDQINDFLVTFMSSNDIELETDES